MWKKSKGPSFLTIAPGGVWHNADDMDLAIQPIGRVEARRTTAEDDNWGGEQSRIVLDDRFAPEALDGIEEFSHAEILFVFDQVDPADDCHGRSPSAQ